MKMRPFALSMALASTTLVFSTLSFAQSSNTSLSSVSSAPAPAAESTVAPTSAASTSTTSQTGVLGQKKFEDSYTLTDAKLRAEDGSLSRYSLKFSLSYYGPTLNDWSVADQPNPNGSNGPVSTSLGGSMTGRYRLSPDRTISVGTGIKAVHPFHAEKRTDVNTPFISYDMASRIGGFQMRNSPSVSIVTVPEYTKIGEFAGISWDTNLVRDLGDSKFAVAFDTGFGYYFYNREYRDAKKGGDGKANQYNISFAPSIKYNFNRKFSMNTSIGWSFWNPRSLDNRFALWNNMATQRIGAGYSVARDIYFAPYVTTYINRYAWDTTTFNFSTIFSIL